MYIVLRVVPYLLLCTYSNNSKNTTVQQYYRGAKSQGTRIVSFLKTAFPCLTHVTR